MKKVISIIVIMVMLISSVLISGTVSAEENCINAEDFYNKTIFATEEIEYGIDYSDEYLQYLEDLENNDIDKYGEVIPSPLPPIDASGDAMVSRSLILPSKYDPRENEMTTAVKNQSSRGVCWAFSALAGAEQSLLKNEDLIYDLSENYYNYLLAGNAFGDNTSNSLSYNNRKLDKGSFSEYVFGAMINQYGAINEVDFPYSFSGYLESENDLIVNPDVYAYGYDVFRSLSGTLTDSVMDARINEIKKAIYENGSCNLYQEVNTAQYYQNYNANYKSLYLPLTSTTISNHALCIVGWDDSYSKENFNQTPTNDGAFIVKNSWGSGYGDGGYYYLSYEDYYIYCSQLSSVKDVVNEKRYDKMDSYVMYDAEQGYTGYSDTFYVANVFDTELYSRQEIAAVGVYTLFPGAEFEIYVNPYNATLSTDAFIKVFSGIADRSGYETYELETPVEIVSSDGKYAVAIKYLSDGSGSDYYSHFAVENASGIYRTSNAGESFYSANGIAWNDCSARGKNVYVNAYTNYINENESESLSVRFYKPASWGDNVYIHIWDTATQNTVWPGNKMTKRSDGSYQYDNIRIENCKIVINDGTHQTADLSVSGRVTVKDGKIIDRSSKPIEVLFKKPTYWSDDVRIYYYSNDPNEVQRSAWPGESMDNIGQGYFKYTITDMASVRILFTDGTYQTPSVNAPGFLVNAGQKLVYRDNNYSYEEVDTLNFMFKKPDLWGDTIYIHLWNASGYETVWPGIEMTQLANGYYQYKNDDLYSCNAVISDGTRKTRDLDLVGYKTFINGQIIEDSSQEIQVTFVKPDTWDDNVRIYYYSNDNIEAKSQNWPGYEMVNNGDGIYSYTITDMAYVRVIFNDGTNQTPIANMQGYTVMAGQHIIYNSGNIIYTEI